MRSGLFRLAGAAARHRSLRQSECNVELQLSRLLGDSSPRSGSRQFARGRDDNVKESSEWAPSGSHRKGKLPDKFKKKVDADEFWAKQAVKAAADKTPAQPLKEVPPQAAAPSKAVPPPPKTVDVPEGVTVRELARRLQA